MSQHKFKTTNIKGKQYVEVNERVKAFRALPEFKSMSLETEIYAVDSESVIIRAVVRDEAGRIVSTGFAHEEKSSSNINRTSYIENCETSAVGRALGMLGIGIDTSIATADEVETAIAKQEAPQQVVEASEPEKEETLFEKSVNYIKAASNKREAYSQVVTKYGDKFSEKQVLALEKFVK
jgi:hypothetical protein